MVYVYIVAKMVVFVLDMYNTFLDKISGRDPLLSFLDEIPEYVRFLAAATIFTLMVLQTSFLKNPVKTVQERMMNLQRRMVSRR